MKISELIEKLKAMQDQLGDVPVVVPVDTEDEHPLEEATGVLRLNAGRTSKPKMVVLIS